MESVMVWAVFSQFYAGVYPIEHLTGRSYGYQVHRTFEGCEKERIVLNELYGENWPDDKDAINYVCKPLLYRR